MEEKLCFRVEETMTPQLLGEFITGSRDANPLLYVSRPMMILVSILAVWLAVRYPWAMANQAALLVAVCVGVLALDLIPRFVGRKSGGIQYKRSLLANDGKPIHNELLFTENKILDRNLDNGNQVTYRYDQIRRIYETSRLLVLMMDYRVGILVDKEGLSGGSVEELKAFLLGKAEKIRKKRIRGTTYGKYLHHVTMVAVVLLLMVSIATLPAVQYRVYLHQNPVAGQSVRELAENLEQLGITGTDQFLLDDLEIYYDSLTPVQKIRASKPVGLLSCLGYGSYAEDTWDWIPSENGVFYLSTEAWNTETMYTDLLRGIRALDQKQLDFSEISEDWSGVDYEAWTGTISVTFTYGGQPQSLLAQFDGEWVDLSVLEQLREILARDGDNRELCWVDDGGEGLLIFYRDRDWMEAFRQATGLSLGTELPIY